MKALIAIGTQSAISGGAATIPTPAVETVKHIALAGNELILCANIYQIYYEEKITTERIEELLKDAGILAAEKCNRGTSNERRKTHGASN